LTDIHNTQQIFGLIRQGAYLDRKKLDDLLSMTYQKVHSLK
jgi:hypothetical protein